MSNIHNRKVSELTEIAIRAEIARRDVNQFCEFAMRDQDGRPWIQQPFHREWQQLIPLQGPARVLIGAPREHAKTTQMIARVIWELGRNRNIREKVVCATDALASDFVSNVA
jgi:hypothetical protein